MSSKVFNIVIIILSVALITSILLQQHGSSLGSAFGGDSVIHRSRRGVEKWLYYLTIGLAVIFVVFAVAGLVFLNS